MKLKNNVAAKAIAAGLSFALAMGGVAAPATLAFASGTGNITIAKRADGDTTTMTGYQIFTADVADVQGVKVASNVAWANGSVKTIVENAIKAATNNSYSGTTAQDAADWLHDNQTQSGNSVVLDYNSFLDNLAQTLRTADGMTTAAVTPGTASSLDAGYWLFLTDTTSTDDASKVDQVGTSPIYTLVGASDLNITQKTGSVKDAALGTGTGETQSYKLEHHAKAETISVKPASAKWKYRDATDVLQVTAAKGEAVSVSYDWAARPNYIEDLSCFFNE